MRQSALTIAVPIDPKRASSAVCQERVAMLREQLVAARGGASGAAASPIAAELGKLLAAPADGDAGLHSLGCFAIAPEGAAPGYLVLELIGDGSEAALRQRVSAVAPAFLLALFAESPELSASALPAFLRRHSLPAGVFYAASPGRSVAQIREEQQLRRELRGHYRAAGSERPSGACPRVAGAASSRLSPTSASAAWRMLSDAFGERALVRASHRRPLHERWNLGNGGWRERLELWGRRLRAVLAPAAALLGMLLLQQDPGLAAVRGPLAVSALAVAVAALASVALITWREGPRSLRLAGHLLVLREISFEQLRTLYSLGLAFGSIALVGSVALRMSVTQNAVSALVVGALWLGLSVVGLADVGVAAISAALVGAAVLPPAWLPLIPAGALAGLCAGMAALLAALVYVMLGRAAAWLSVVVFGMAGAAHLWWHTRSQPLGASDLLGMSAIGVAALLGLLGLGALWVGRWLVAVRSLERQEALSSPAAGAGTPSESAPHTEPSDSGAAAPGASLQNLVLVSRLKPGALRRCTLQRTLRAVQLLDWAMAGRGEQSGARNVRFARFALLPDGQRLLSSCEYHGGFDALSSAAGSLPALTAVFSNCVGFPQAYFLAGDGASDEQHFRAFGRRDQLPLPGWQAAHSELSVRDIEAAARLRADLQRPIDDPLSWQGRLRRRFAAPLREADCDQALRSL